MVLISTVTFIVSTAEELQEDSAYPLVALRLSRNAVLKLFNFFFSIDLIDNFVVVFFSFEYLVRLVLCPNKMKVIIARYISNLYSLYSLCETR